MGIPFSLESWSERSKSVALWICVTVEWVEQAIPKPSILSFFADGIGTLGGGFS